MSDALATEPGAFIILRSAVAPRASYREYLPHLEYDFWYSCAYCTLCQAEAQGLSFSIDHYEPKSKRPELASLYSNLMYACTGCNSHKGDVWPSAEMREKGFRFFKADVDDPEVHFSLDGTKIIGVTPTGEFTVEALNLNRGELVRLREIRATLNSALKHIRFGLRGLQRIPLDQLPSELKIRFRLAQVEIGADTSKLDEKIRTACQSPLLSVPADGKAHTSARRAYLKRVKALSPDPWDGEATTTKEVEPEDAKDGKSQKVANPPQRTTRGVKPST